MQILQHKIKKKEMNELIKQQRDRIEAIENARITSQLLSEFERDELQNKLEYFQSLYSSITTKFATERAKNDMDSEAAKREIRSLKKSMCYTQFN